MSKVRQFTDLQNYDVVLRDVAAGKPVFLTENGHERYVIMDICDYTEVQRVNYLINEIAKEDFSGEDKAITAIESPYVQYSLKGLCNLRLTRNRKIALHHLLVKSVLIQEELKWFALVLNEGVQYVEQKTAIDLFAKQLFFSMVVQTDADINQPRILISSYVDGERIDLVEYFSLDEDIVCLKEEPADYVYKKIIDTAWPAFDTQKVRYERILSTLQNPSLVIQFISLYQLLMELLGQKASVKHPSQQNVYDYFFKNSKKYPDVTFRKTRKKDREFEEDSFTYLRNELAHCEETNDMILYLKLGSSITCQTIKQLARVINDVIIEMS